MAADYLSPKRLAQAMGVSESSVKRWVDDGSLAAQLTAGGHRRIPRTEAVRFLRATGRELADPQILGLDTLAGGSPPASLQELGQRFEAALLEADASQATSLLASAFLGGARMADLVDGAIQPALEVAGELYLHQSDGIAAEHLATSLCQQALHDLRGLLPPPGEDAPVAAGGAPPGDVYLLPSLAASVVLQEAGFKTLNLGPETPLRSLETVVRRSQAGLVWLSVSTPEAAARIAEPLEGLRKRLRRRRAALVVGGRGAHALGLESRAGLQVGGSMAELAAFARGLATRD